MQRIVVIGTTGSGKSTLAQQLAARLDAQFIEMDALYWQPGWQAPAPEWFRERVAQAVSAERWVLAGNYSKVRDLTWGRADTLVWLDYPFPLVIQRLFRRTLTRIVTQENLWNSGNTESWRGTFLSPDSLFVWAVKTHWKYRRSIALTTQQPEYAHLRVQRFLSPGEAQRWLAAVNPTT